VSFFAKFYDLLVDFCFGDLFLYPTNAGCACISEKVGEKWTQWYKILHMRLYHPQNPTERKKER